LTFAARSANIVEGGVAWRRHNYEHERFVSPQDLKKALVGEGFEVFRIAEGAVVLAERVRENLILDSGVRVVADPMEIKIVFRVQQSDFPQEEENALFTRARSLAASATPHGFNEVATAVSNASDPADPSRILDTFYEVTVARGVASIADAIPLLKTVLAFEKTPAAS